MYGLGQRKVALLLMAKLVVLTKTGREVPGLIMYTACKALERELLKTEEGAEIMLQQAS